jgi:hypothetical protein
MPPLLLIHGAPLTHLSWSRVAPELAKKYTVVAPFPENIISANLERARRASYRSGDAGRAHVPGDASSGDAGAVAAT